MSVQKYVVHIIDWLQAETWSPKNINRNSQRAKMIFFIHANFPESVRVILFPFLHLTLWIWASDFVLVLGLVLVN